MVIVLVAQAKILGSDAPGTLLGWVAALFVVWGALTAFVGLFSTFASLVTKRQEIFSKLAGAVLPLGWLIWGAALLHADPTPIRIGIVAAGVVVMLVTTLILWLFYRDKDAGK